MQKILFAAAFAVATLVAGSASAAPAAYKDPLDTATLTKIGARRWPIWCGLPKSWKYRSPIPGTQGWFRDSDVMRGKLGAFVDLLGR